MNISLAIGGVIAAIIAFSGGRFAYNKEKNENSRKLLNSLFGELSHALQHYTYASYELPQNAEQIKDKKELKKRLLWSKYGDFQSSKEFQKYGFLSQIEIRELLQLSFVIRNTDSLIEMLLENLEDNEQKDLSYLKDRMGIISKNAEQLLNYIVSINPEFDVALKAAKKM